MGMRWGDKTVQKRDSVIEEGCLGAEPPLINGLRLMLGSIQKMKFEVGDECPYYERGAPRHVPNEIEEKIPVMQVPVMEETEQG